MANSAPGLTTRLRILPDVLSDPAYFVHAVRQLTTGLHVGKNDVAVKGEQRLIGLVTIASCTRDMEFHQDHVPAFLFFTHPGRCTIPMH